MTIHKPSVAIIGAGSVGSTIAYSAMLRRIPAIIRLVDINSQLARGQAMDLSDTEFLTPTQIAQGTFQQAGQSDVVVITAGAKQKPGESRMQCKDRNIIIIKKIIDDMRPINPNAVILVVTNPVDSMTRVAQEHSGLPRSQVFGSGTFLDTMRLRRHLSSLLSVNESNVHCNVLGEHGDNQFVCWSQATIGSTPLTKFVGADKLNFQKIEQEVMETAYRIIEDKGSTYYGIGACVARLLENVLFDSREVKCVSCWSETFGTVLSMPAVVGSKGAELVIHVPLDESESSRMQRAAEATKM